MKQKVRSIGIYNNVCHQDLINIGIKPIGYVRRLEKAIKELSQSPVHAGIPVKQCS